MKRFGLVLALALSVSACAHLQTKQTLVVSLQSVDLALSAAQNFEQGNHATLGLDAPASPTEKALCPSSTAVLPSAATRHQVISCLFAVAFDNEAKAGTMLAAWKAGDPTPQSLTDLQGDVDQALVLARSLLTSPTQQQLIADIQAVADTVLSVVRTVKGA